MLYRIVAMTMVLGAASGCTSQEDADVEIQMRAVVDGAEGLVAVDDRGADLVIDAASLTVDEIELYLPPDVACESLDFGSCADAGHLIVPGPFAADLVGGMLAAELTLPPGTYRRAHARISIEAPAEEDEEAKPTDEPEATPVTFSISGALRILDHAPRVDVGLSLDEDIEFQGPIEITGGGDEIQTVVLALDATRWLKKVALKNCLFAHDAEAGPFVIGEDDTSSDKCAANLRDQIRENVQASGNLRLQ